MEKIIRDEKFYGRMKARELTDRQKDLYDTLFKEVSITSINEIDSSQDSGVFLEIGFGGGEHIAKMAIMNPDKLFIGCEPFINGVASLLTKIDDDNIKNIRIFKEDAKKLIREMPCNFLEGAFLLFPDPWPKRRHFPRRFVQVETINEVYRVLKNGANWKIATDHPEYGKWILKMFEKEPFCNMFSRMVFNKNTRPSEESWPKTRYEQKAVGDIVFAVYEKM